VVPGGTDACNILHVDMDAFFASVEVLDDPNLAGKPVIVGGAGARGVVASCTYEARAYGIHSAMSSYEARRRCPHAVFVAGRYDRYTETSERLHSVLLRFTPLIEGIALDEAFLDVSGARRLIGPPPVIAELIRGTVRRELGLSCCVGVARTKLLAKLASRAAKPVPTLQGNRPGPGVVVVPANGELSFLHPLPIRALWGIGPATARRLEGLGVSTVGDMARIPDEALRRLLGAAAGRHLAALARGEDDRPVEPLRVAKSVGHEETFPFDLRDQEDLHRHVLRMADAVASRLRETDLRGRTITVKVRYPDRSTISRSQTLPTPTDSPRAITAVAGALLRAVDVTPGVRLIGVSLSALSRRSAVSRQLCFETDSEAGPSRWCAPDGLPGPDGDAPRASEAAWEEVEAAVLQIRVRYGRSAVSSANLVGPDGISVKRRGDTQWGPRKPPVTGG
jgi:DNA polymerase-4